MIKVNTTLTSRAAVPAKTVERRVVRAAALVRLDPHTRDLHKVARAIALAPALPRAAAKGESNKVLRGGSKAGRPCAAADEQGRGRDVVAKGALVTQEAKVGARDVVAFGARGPRAPGAPFLLANDGLGDDIAVHVAAAHLDGCNVLHG